VTIDTVLNEIRIIDVDTHIIEPPDLWTSRVAGKFVDRVPQLHFDEELGWDMWYLEGERLFAPGSSAFAGHDEYPPYGPKRFTDIDPAIWEPKARLAKLDEYGVHGQLLYPNIATFAARNFMSSDGRDVHNICIQVYNNYLTEFASVAPDRYFPMAAIPFWDIELSIKELERCHYMGHRGFLFSQNPSAFGLPTLYSRHWDPIWSAAQEMGMVVNFHIGSAIGFDSQLVGIFKEREDAQELGMHAAYSVGVLNGILSNAHTLSMLTNGGVCHRFPDLNFVLVESGVGWLPYAVDLLDWQWQAAGADKENPERLLPSEYFRRQIYGAFWFESRTAKYAVEQYPDNVLFETDFPHPISLSPGPASPAPHPIEHLRNVLHDCPDDTMQKVLQGNAARVYHLP
jgi:predicted TIM-barrel fold metal-dependent hydrolase